MDASAGAKEPGTAVKSQVKNQKQSDSRVASNVRDEGPRERVAEFLHTHGADEIAHLDGSLFDHLERTELLLRGWGSTETVSLAGLCHAVYGTDGFPTALLTLEERNVVSEVAGSDVEALVYLYASCDRGYAYARLSGSAQRPFKDRFTGRTFKPTQAELRDFVDITLANEFDVGIVGPKANEPPKWLMAMFRHFQTLASGPVRDWFEPLVSTTCR
jgi:hypothetical protein